MKSKISDVHSNRYTKIKINSDDELSLEEPVNIHNVVILISSVFNENHNHYYYHVILEKCSYKKYKNTIL